LKKRTFKSHIFEDHNLYNYMFYIAYINNKDKTELTGIESYVKHCLDQKEIKWFPI